MCRNIKKLRQQDSIPSDEELHLAALQFVRKVSGFRTPSRRNAAAFDHAGVEIAGTTQKLLEQLVAPPVRARSETS